MAVPTKVDAAALRAAYEAGKKTLGELLEEFHIGHDRLRVLARNGGWVRAAYVRPTATASVDWEAVRRAYEAAEEPVAHTAERFGISLTAIYSRMHRQGCKRARRAYRKDGLTSPPASCTPQAQQALVQRLYDILGAQIAAAAQPGSEDASPDKATRQLEQLVKCFKTIHDLRAALGGSDNHAAKEDERSAEEIFEAIQRRLDQRLEASPEDEGAQDPKEHPDAGGGTSP